MKSALASSSRRHLLTSLFALSLPAVRAIAAPMAAPTVAQQPSDAVPPAALVYASASPRSPSAKPPVLFLMHGYGADEKDLLDLASSLAPDWLIVSFRAPYANSDGGYRWYDHRTVDGQTDGNPVQLQRSAQAVMASITTLMHKFDGDPKRVFIGGFSQGAVMTYLLALSHPTVFRGAVVLSGEILPSELALLTADPGFDTQPRIPMFVGHGTADRTIPFWLADQSAMYLSRWHVPLTFQRYSGMGHAIDAAELADLNAWLTPLYT